ncbi:anthranilate synthase component 1 [Paucidesulfovibrio gracilis DSM 16080]|uniref:Anthranilate synthase component 1 n=1 Tax=Paucidesulfovibrio gracilis DSM 16080 TaxID=1121449 RepID=A0A1T4W3V1_9BACT|nr:anthranilate synthase component I family protein [Paucidesulfovibrio gracilis]SKA71940.1 anthranilate synthase component 1 [Paucidesulfovibrio gracilis DSM 16080]
MRLTLTQFGQWLPADVQTPISLYLGLVGDAPGILLESAEVDGRLGRYSLMAWDFRCLFTQRQGRLAVDVLDQRLRPLAELNGMPCVEGLRRALAMIDVRQSLPKQDGSPASDREDLPPITRSLIGYLGYGVAGLLEPELETALPAEDADLALALPGRMVLFDHLRHRCCFLSLDRDDKPLPKPVPSFQDIAAPRAAEAEPESTPERAGYKAAVERAKELIRDGECIQVVLSTRFTAPLTDAPFRIYRRLRQANPSPFMFYMHLPDGSGEDMTLLGSSPEMLVRCDRGHLEVRPIAGTRPRGADEAEDQSLAEELLADPKERAEHVMLVDLGRNDLGRIAAPGSVNVRRFMQVERFSHVMHLTSYVDAQLRDGLDALDVLAATFPAGTVSGAPKIRAMEIIADLEAEHGESRPRGPYAGCIGWLGLGAGPVSLDTGITIRSLWIRGEQIHWQAGAGIVFDSDPEKEWQECNNKARVLREVVRGREDGDVFADR